MNKEQAEKLLEIYGRAWEARDADLITTIFAVRDGLFSSLREYYTSTKTPL